MSALLRVSWVRLCKRVHDEDAALLVREGPLFFVCFREYGVRPRYEKSPLNQFHASLMGFVLIVGTLVIFSALGIILSI